ncbi:MAG: type II toxin-antitoxin system VapC family toxin [Chloroflexota bacterium]|nr:type II toxin-antitoxin system VapC family toxin [Chloroflexota bacterium]
MYLLDTVVVSALRRPERHVPVIRWLQVQPPEDLYISVITVGEIMYGAARQRRKQPAFAELLDRWLESVSASFQYRVLPFDEAAARRWGLLHAELGYTNSDLQIAAIALHRDLAVVTRNVRDFVPTGVAVLNPFEEPDG